ncbi:glycosyltransferase [Betaproteobacteria bacterium GR16-43]|nr:glycosyltransferase [Betaproteobacteria bacterium GR16-43]
MIRVFIGYDEREAGAFSVLSYSIHQRATQPVSITPVMLDQLKPAGLYWREANALASTDFSFSRFLTPYLCGFQGWAIFTDNDMLVRDDIAKLWALRDERFAVQVVKHHHVPKEETKFLGRVQTKYEKKNWSSVMLMNCAKCTTLTPDYVNNASGLELHQFKWLASDDLIGELPARWNHLVGYDAYREDAALVHFTSGGPYFAEYEKCDYAQDWFDEQKRMNNVTQREKAAKTA